jgi:hypothetical protein
MIYCFVAAWLVFRGKSQWSRVAGKANSAASLSAVGEGFPERGRSDLAVALRQSTLYMRANAKAG